MIDVDVWKAAFAAGRLAALIGAINGKVIDYAIIRRRLRKPKSRYKNSAVKSERINEARL